METIKIQVKPREEIREKQDTRIDIKGDHSRTPTLPKGETLNDQVQCKKSSKDNTASTSPKQTQSKDLSDRKVKERKTSIDSIEVYSLPDSDRESNVNVSNPNLALSKLAWVEIPIDDDNDSDVNTTTVVESFSDKKESQNDEKADRKPTGASSDASVQADVGNNEAKLKGSGTRDNRIILSPGSLPSGVDVGTNTSSVKSPKRVPDKRKKLNFKRRVKRGVYVIPCDDHPNPPNGEAGNSSINPSAAAGVILNTETEGQRNDSDSVSELEPRNKTYFHYLLESFFWLALCPKRIDKDAWIGNWIPFILLSTAAILYDAIAIKDEYFWTDSVLLRCVGMGLYTVGLFFRVYFAYMITFKYEDIRKLVRLLSSVGPLLPTSKVIAVVVLPVASSILIAILFSIAATVANYAGLDYDIEDLFVWRGYRLSQAIFLWNREDRDNQTEQMLAKFQESDVLTPKETFLGITGFFIQITGNLFRIITRDISIVIAASYVTLTTTFVCLLATYKTNPTEEQCNQIWKSYKTLRRVTKYTERAFGVSLLLLHFEDIFLCVDCLFESTIGEDKIYITVLRGCILAKVAYFYITAAIVYRVNGKFRKWILRNFPGTHTLFVENGEYVTTSNALEQLKTEPIAIGSIFFHINDSFLGKFAAYVCSAFLFFVDHNE